MQQISYGEDLLIEDDAAIKLEVNCLALVVEVSVSAKTHTYFSVC